MRIIQMSATFQNIPIPKQLAGMIHDVDFWEGGNDKRYDFRMLNEMVKKTLSKKVTIIFCDERKKLNIES
jgi:hypothetical protein